MARGRATLRITHEAVLEELGTTLHGDLSKILEAHVQDLRTEIRLCVDQCVSRSSVTGRVCNVTDGSGNGHSSLGTAARDSKDQVRRGPAAQAWDAVVEDSLTMEEAVFAPAKSACSGDTEPLDDLLWESPLESETVGDDGTPIRRSNSMLRAAIKYQIEGQLFGQDANDSVGIASEEGSGMLEFDSAPAKPIPIREENQYWRRRLKRIVDHARFDYGFGAVIILNALSIGVQADYVARTSQEDVPLAMQLCDTVFCVLFTLELILRFTAHGCSFFYMHGWPWNWFDCVLVGMQLFEEVAALIVRVSSVSYEGGSNLSFLRMLRILRLVRVIRLARVLRLVRQLRTLVCSIGASLHSLAWTVLLQMFMIYVVGIYFTQLVATNRLTISDEQKESAHSKAMSLYFGTLADSCLSLYQSISGGVNWNQLLRPFVDEISPLIAPLFTFYIAFSVLAMMNVVTGVFVESALQSTSQDKEEHLINQLQEWCVGMDNNNDGGISLVEFDKAMQDPVHKLRFENLDLNMQDARKLIVLLDLDKTGQVPIGSFIMGCLRLRGAARSIDVATLLFEQKRFIRIFQRHAEVVEAAFSRNGDVLAAQPGNRTISSSLPLPEFQGMRQIACRMPSAA